MSEENQASFSGWAKVEVMGHQSHIGFVETQAFGQAVLFRIDRPEIAEREEVLKRPEYGQGGYFPAGATVRRPKVEACSVLVGSGSIYRIIPCSEDAAMRAIAESERPPLILVRMPAGVALPAPSESEDEDDSADDDPFETDRD